MEELVSNKPKVSAKHLQLVVSLSVVIWDLVGRAEMTGSPNKKTLPTNGA